MIRLLYSKSFKNYLCIMLTLYVTELIFRYVLKFPILDYDILRSFLGVNIVALILGALYSFTGRIAGNILTFLTTFVLSIYAIVQAGFYSWMGTMSLGNSTQAGAITDYIGDFIACFHWSYWLILIPSGILLLFYILFENKIYIQQRNELIDFSDKFDSKERKELNEVKRVKKEKAGRISEKISAVVISVLFAVAFYFSMTLPFLQSDTDIKTSMESFLNPDLPDTAIQQFGFTSYLLIDVKSVLIPFTGVDNSQVLDSYEKQTQVVSDYIRLVEGDAVWEELIKKETNADNKNLHNYFFSREITDKNDYTGIFNDKNLIVIMMESVNNIVLDEKYYPNISKLYKEGWSWDNAYSPRNSCSTGNNETSAMISLFSINNLCTANKYKDNTYPESIFELFNKKGYSTSSFHNYTDYYYYRSIIHPNMGSGKFYGVKELGIPYSNVYQEWPSDVELMEKVLTITEDEDKFMTWVTTVTSHQPYRLSSEYGDKYLDLFADTNYDIQLKRYMSKLKVLDDAIGVLLEGLEEQGKLDDTVIVLFSDHYPYGLSDNILNQYFEYDVGVNMESDRTPFIIYNSGISSTKYDEYTSFINLTPTIGNLFNLTYDPRLYVGSDVLSKNYEDRVIFANGSWQDKNAFYNATTGEITYFTYKDYYTAEQIKEINNDIRLRISMSNLAIKVDYFANLKKGLEDIKANVVVDE